jgi:hypothetical protein
MPTVHPISASGTREAKKPAVVPKKVRAAIVLMVRGRPDDEDNKPLDFVEAAKLADVQAYVVRNWLDRTEGRKYLAAERVAFRITVCAGNELALKRVRDTSENGMAVIGSVRALEGLDEEAKSSGRGGIQQAPGFVIVIQPPAAAPTVIRPGVTIDHQADEAPPDGSPTERSPAVPGFPPCSGTEMRQSTTPQMEGVSPYLEG